MQECVLDGGLLRPKGLKFETESGRGVLGEGQQAHSPPARGSGRAVSSPGGVRGGVPTTIAFWIWTH